MQKIYNFCIILLIIIINQLSYGCAQIFRDDDKQESLDTQLAIQREGFPSEKYTIKSDDGYIINIFRIPGNLTNPSADGKSVVYLQHGLLDSSASWTLLGEKCALSYMLANAGYDVWLGNTRGNFNGRSHITLSPDRFKFWDYTWHNIGIDDLPTIINFILQITKQEKLHYVGHSQGTTTFFVMGSERSEMMTKIKSMHALAPVAFMSNLKSPLRTLTPLSETLESMMKMTRNYEFLPNNEMMVKAAAYMCQHESPIIELCANAVFLMVGYNSEQLKLELIPKMLDIVPAGASMYQIFHYVQLIKSGKFRYYDYGAIRNVIKYKSITPPDYDLTKVTAPVYLYYSDNDWMSARIDVEKLAALLPNVISQIDYTDNNVNHIDYLFGTNSDERIYKKIIEFINTYE